MRHRVLGHNLANVNTPGYQRVDVRFEDLLTRSDTPLGSRIVVDPNAIPRGDGNTVDIDREINEINKNSLAATAYIQILASKLSMMSTAISGR